MVVAVSADHPVEEEQAEVMETGATAGTRVVAVLGARWATLEVQMVADLLASGMMDKDSAAVLMVVALMVVGGVVES